MTNILLPTRNDRGGLGRYIEAIATTFPGEVTMAAVEHASYLSMARQFRTARQVWVNHVLPVGTAAWLSRTPYVVFLHGLDFDLARRTPWKQWLTRQVLRGAKAVVTNSRALAQEVGSFAGIAMPLVMYPCVDDVLREAAEVPHVPHVKLHTTLLTVGRLVERKGHCKVLRAMVELPNTMYDIVGDGPMRGAIVAEVQRLGLDRRVRLHGEVADHDLPSFFRGADVFVMPSTKSERDREGFGIVYLEANLFDLPVVAVASPGVDEAVLHDRTGMLVEDTHDALVDALLRLQDPALRAALGMAGRERVLTTFTREAQCGVLRPLL